VTPSGPPTLRLDRDVLSSGGEGRNPDGGVSCRPSGDDPRETLVVRLETQADGTLKNWTLQPPHGCDGTPQCGYVLLRVDGCLSGFTGPTECELDPARHLELIAVGGSISVPMKSLAPSTGRFRLEVQLRNSDGSVAASADGTPFPVDSLLVEVEPSCFGGSDGGSDASAPKDGGPPDASAPDGATDASPSDASPGADAVAPTDARAPEGGSSRDASPVGDAAAPRDAAVHDAASRG
jgi:hypothetical protein